MTTKLKTVPELRFPGFEGPWRTQTIQSMLDDGVILGHLDGNHGELYPRAEEFASEGVPYIAANNFCDGEVNFRECKFLPTERAAKFRKGVAKDGDVLFAHNATVGPTAILKTVLPFVILSTTATYYRCDAKRLSNGFLRASLQAYYFVRQYSRVMSQSTRNQIPISMQRTFFLQTPALPEQRKIADFLTAVDGRIGQLIQKKALLEDYKKGAMQQLFTQALRFKDDQGNDFPEWEERKLGAVCRILKGKGLSKADLVEDGDIPCIRYGELYTIYSELIQETQSRTNVPEKELVLSEENDVIIPASGETHIDIATASCVMSKGIALGGDLNIIRTKLNGVFLAYYLNNACKHAIASVAQGSSVIHLYPDQLKGLSLRFPSPAEQTKIANFLTALDRKIESVAQQITHTQTFKKGLLQQMFV